MTNYTCMSLAGKSRGFGTLQMLLAQTKRRFCELW